MDNSLEDIQSYGSTRYVLFIGHARSGHSLIRAILDAQTEIIHEYKLIGEWSNFKLKSSSGLKTRVLFALHALSRFQAMFGNRVASRRSGGGYSYSVPGQWQGTYEERVKVQNWFSNNRWFSKCERGGEGGEGGGIGYSIDSR